ncbi:hypothetical protein [Paenibacillus popilliae]|nr:hypothetical protein [Paenibacillus popilliae]
MEIQINAKPLCTIADEFLPDVYQLLGKYSFTFHLDKSKQILNVVNPLHNYQIVLENKGGSVASPLLQIMRHSLKHAGFYVWVIETEQDRERCSEEWDSGKQSMWLTLQPVDEKKKEIVVYYFLHQIKASRQLANLLVQNIARYSDMPIQGVSFHWKSGLSYILPQPGQTLNLAGLAYGGYDSMGVEEQQQLTDGVVGAATIFFGKKPLMELMKQLRILEERQIEAGQRLPRPASSVSVAKEADLVREPAVEGLEEPIKPEWTGEESAEDGEVGAEESEFVQQARQAALKLETTKLNPIRVHLAEGAESRTLHREPAAALTPAEAVPDRGPLAGEEPVGEALPAGDENPADTGARVREAAEATAHGEHNPAAERKAKPRTTNYSMFVWMQSHSGNRVHRNPERRQQPQSSFFSYVSQLNQSQQSTDKRTQPKPFHMLAMDRARSRKP